MSVNCKKEDFGQLSTGEKVWLFTLKNDRGMTACITNYGAILAQLHVPDSNGNFANVVLGFSELSPYQAKHPHLGGTIGRYANRIAGANFNLDGRNYKLAANNGANCLHGGINGFDKKLWTVEDPDESVRSIVRLSYLSPHMEEGFPGNLKLYVSYELTPENSVRIEYSATTDQSTPINLTNHSYFNLKGAGNGDVLDHELTLLCDSYTPVNEQLLPTGAIASVEDTALDFREPRTVGSRIGEMEIGGYDHNFVVRESDEQPALAAVVSEPTSGRRLRVFTTEPGIQIYTGNSLNGSVTGLGGAYNKYYAICLETQHFPDSVHHSNFPNVILHPGDEYRQTTIFDFGS